MQTDAEVWLTVKEAEILRGDWIDPDAGPVPLNVYAEEWIAERPGLAPRTTALYERLLRLHIESTRLPSPPLIRGGRGEPAVGELMGLTRADIDLAAGTVRVLRSVLRCRAGSWSGRPSHGRAVGRWRCRRA
jgi:hypothetical protein